MKDADIKASQVVAIYRGSMDFTDVTIYGCITNRFIMPKEV